MEMIGYHRKCFGRYIGGVRQNAYIVEGGILNEYADKTVELPLSYARSDCVVCKEIIENLYHGKQRTPLWRCLYKRELIEKFLSVSGDINKNRNKYKGILNDDEALFPLLLLAGSEDTYCLVRQYFYHYRYDSMVGVMNSLRGDVDKAIWHADSVCRCGEIIIENATRTYGKYLRCFQYLQVEKIFALLGHVLESKDDSKILMVKERIEHLERTKPRFKRKEYIRYLHLKLKVKYVLMQKGMNRI
ncbi:MAG: hypothetical protein LIO67_01400 [Lachnospiraceae bacterium]|nr:hypothetical protein [Lachnospiraceae bacterium]